MFGHLQNIVATRNLMDTLASINELHTVEQPTPTIATPIPDRPVHWFILYGGDYRAGDAIRTESGQQTDAIVLVSITEPPVTINTYSLARELLDADRNLKINQHFAHCGYTCIYDYYQNEWGIELEGIVLVNMSNFVYFVDGLGGVELTATVNTHDQCGDNWYTFVEGETYSMNGDELLCYARMRKNSPNGYFHRQLRWRDVMVALGEQIGVKFREQPVDFVAQTVEQIRVLFWTDLSFEQQVDWSVFAFNNVFGDEYNYCHWSLDYTVLELLPRPNGNEPYQYRALVEVDEWLQENRCE